MNRAAPSWIVPPVGMNEAALALGVSRRKLVDLVKEHPLSRGVPSTTRPRLR